MIAWPALAAFAATDPEAALSRGMAAQRAGDVDAAKTAYRECLAAAPEHIGCRWELGWSAWSERDWEEVVVQWEAVQRADPAHPELDKWLTIAQGHVASLTQLRALATTAPATARAPLPEGTTVRLRAVGDIMLGTDFPHPTDYLPPQDGAHLLDAVAPALQDADFTFGNLEGPLCDGGETTKCGEGENCYAFRTPTRYGAYLVDAGFDLMSTANNHSGDFGESCRRETEATLDSLGIAWSGPPGSIATIDVDDVAVALVAFHTSPACNDVNDRETAKLLVAAAAARADLVVVSFHGGAEGSKALHVPQGQETFYGENRGSLRAFARDVVGAGADLVIGHGPWSSSMGVWSPTHSATSPPTAGSAWVGTSRPR